MNFKKLFSSLFFLCFLSLITVQGIKSSDDVLGDPDIFDDSFDINLTEDELLSCLRTKFDPFDVLDILVNVMGFNSILQADVFLRTNPLTQRNILDLPMGMMNKNYLYDNWISAASFFYNMTDRSYFDQDCDAIDCYLALTDDDFLAEIREASQKVKDFELAHFDFDPAEVLALFANGTVQERRFGFLLYGRKALRWFDFSWKLPFYYLERNFWFTEEEQDIIEKRLIEIGVEPMEPEDQEKFQSEHMISDKLGFGDLRFAFDFPMPSSGALSSRAGVHITIPTAWAWAKGMAGSEFKPQVHGRETDLKELIGYHLDELFTLATGTPEQKQQATDALTDLAYKAIDHTSANLLESPLGNGRHTGIGVDLLSEWPLSVFIKRPWASNIIFKGFMSLEYLLPATETRFFKESVDNRLLDSLDIENESKAEQNMIFYEQQIVNKLFPYACDVSVYPGIIFRWTSKATYETNRWGLHLGTDTWIKTKEHLYDIRVKPDLCKRLNLEKGRGLFGYQSKFLGSLFWKIKRSNRDWTLSLNGDVTMFRSGIGGDFTLFFDLEVDF